VITTLAGFQYGITTAGTIYVIVGVTAASLRAGSRKAKDSKLILADAFWRIRLVTSDPLAGIGTSLVGLAVTIVVHLIVTDFIRSYTVTVFANLAGPAVRMHIALVGFSTS
jgi:hypothetical protein